MLKKLLVSALAVGSLAFAGEYWHVAPGGTTMKFLSMHVAPRTAAMSGAGIADAARVSEVNRNPLAMGVADTPEFGLNQIVFDGVGTDKFTSVYFGHPVGESFVASGAVEFLGYDEIEGRDENGLKTDDYSAYAWAVQAGFGSRWDVLNWALTARFATQTIDDQTAFAFLADVGGSYRVNKYFAFATTLTNVGYVTEYEDVKEAAPMAVQAGVSGFIPFIDRWALHLSADAYRRADTDAQWLFGGELAYAEALMLRAGYAVRTENGTENGISCGLGVVFGMIVFDYAYEPRPAFEGGNHYFSLGMKF
ncbi:MAG: PorV/PorQ family protein [Fibrobacter sp.]|uniref:PorV/PorQ family protein n=1 Tax=Fibrobacter sp. UWP2 TaxID=1896216 RepID=UPI00091F494B|nr:PorV/PorQ family protein [Fibrobacter sp. UWP2]MBO7384204.1 PorV/PorQ family protein [Fibrobacter sp.]SHJ17167.1 hypothetical protein SAMN05720471_11944 [Fibrobacter sp. UWP2]